MELYLPKTNERKVRSMSESECFVQGRASFMRRLRSSLPLLDDVKEAPIPEEYERFCSPIPVHQMYTFDRAIAAVNYSQGAFSSIKQAREVSTGHVFAVKVTNIGDESLGKMAIKEYELLSSFSHPGILRPTHLILDMLVHKAFMFMPMLCEQTLSDVMAGREDAVSEEEVRNIGRQLMSALREVHTRKVIHRDVNPNNVMYDKEGKVVLIDFQTATKIETGKWMMSYVGTGHFRAPEMAISNVYE